MLRTRERGEVVMRMSAQCLLVVVVLLVMSMPVVQGQMLPSHGGSAMGRSPVVVQRDAPQHTGYRFRNDVGLELVYGPSPRDRRFDEKLGLGANVTFPMQPHLALRVGIGFERYGAKGAGDDADVVPLTLSVLFGAPGEAALPVALQLGLRYNLVDYADLGGEYDNSLGGVLGLVFEPALSDMVSFGFGVSYEFDISKSKNDLGEKFSLEGLDLRLSMRFSF